MKIFNTLSRSKEEFAPLIDGRVTMYVCGPTVYDFGHLGHGRSAVSFDLIRKYLIYKGFEVKFVTNFTDIDDKMINRAEISGITVAELAEKVIPEYEADYGSLGIMKPDSAPRATEFVEQMIDLIKRLEDGGYIYVISDGVYFDVTKFADYGKLSGQDLDSLRAGARKELNDEKRNHQDFVLWKFSKPGEPVWASPWGDGRPGWHIECSAMSRDILGQPFDIHGGGADLTFPHHECEIAQSEAGYGCEFAKYWLHNGFIRIDNEKMSKSLGNFFTLRDIFKKFKPQAVRFLFLHTHYRSPIDFTHMLLEQSEAGLARVHDFYRRLKGFVEEGRDGAGGVEGASDVGVGMEVDDVTEVNSDTGTGVSAPAVSALLSTAKTKFEEAMDDDFETPKALAVCFDLIKDFNKLMDSGGLSLADAEGALELIARFDSVLGIFEPFEAEEVDESVSALIKERDEARAARDFARADEIRDELLRRGIVLEDTAKGTVWKRG